MKKTPLALCVSSVLAMTSFGAAASLPDVADLSWHAITFGQSTDLNFGSTILPEKVGTNEVTIDGQPIVDGALADKFTIESRGGKIANSHDGLTFYYTKLPTDVNFTLSAKVVLEQLGPETGSTPNRQEGAGLMVRDVISAPRLNPQPEGLEEFPAASNMVMNLLRANKRENNGQVNITGVHREGVYSPWGTAGNRLSRNEFAKDQAYGPDKTYLMTLERTDSGYVVSYDNGDVKRTQELNGAHANIVEMQDSEHQYVGFFASRNAKITVSDVDLTLSKANTVDAPRYQAKLTDPLLQQASPDRSAIADYTLQARANYTGTFSVSQDGKALVEGQRVSAGEMFNYTTTLQSAKTKFDVTYTPSEGPDNAPLSYNYTVQKVSVENPLQILVNPKGSNGRLTLEQAIEAVAPGGTILLEDGDYDGLTLSTAVSGLPGQLKTLKAKGDKVRFTGEYLHQANYWNIDGIEVDGARTIVHGSFNNFSNMTTHNAPDTGFQISSPDIGRALWASYNVVTDSVSFNNMDPAQINADGFAAKMRVGDGNTFIRCVAHHNIDDGWDLFNKVEDGSNGVVTILDSVAFMNGRTTEVEPQGGSRGNGFKLGGEGLPVAHIIRNSLAFHNYMDGFTDNFNPGALVVEDNLAIDNHRFNFLFRQSPYSDTVKQGEFIGNASYRFNVESTYSDVVNADVLENNQFIVNGVTVDDAGNAIDVDKLLELRKASMISGNETIPGESAVKQIEQILNRVQ